MKNLLIAVSLLFSISLLGQDTTYKQSHWKYGEETAISLTEASFTNWAAGGENTVASNGYIHSFANYEKGNTLWSNKMDFAFGITKTGGERWKKSEDKIYFESRIGITKTPSLYYTANLDFRTQFVNGYHYGSDKTGDSLVSGFMAPAYLTLGVGIDYKPTPYFSALLTPLTNKGTFVHLKELYDIGSFGVDIGKKSKYEFGANLKLSFNKQVFTNIDLKTDLSLFSNYLSNPQNVDILWDLFINMRINKFLTTNFVDNLIYDEDVPIKVEGGNIWPRNQFKQTVGIGITYKITN